MNYWLVKSEPFKYSWEQFRKDGKTIWDGVRNYAARNNLQAMRMGDKVFYYHSNEGLAIVGIAEVVRESYQDPTTDETAWVVVELAPVETLKRPVTLAEIKSTPKLSGMALIKLGRLSVGPVTKAEFELILKMSENAVAAESTEVPKKAAKPAAKKAAPSKKAAAATTTKSKPEAAKKATAKARK